MIAWAAARKFALSLPESEERDHFGSPSFRVLGKIFAQLSAEAKSERRAVIKLTLADQAALILFDPETFSAVPQWGQHGWTHARLDTIDAAMFEDIVRKSWRLVAPKKLAAALAKGK